MVTIVDKYDPLNILVEIGYQKRGCYSIWDNRLIVKESYHALC